LAGTIRPGAYNSAPGRINGSVRPLHFAGGRQNGLRGVDLGYQMPAPTRVFLVERVLRLVAHAAERGDIDRLEELVVVRTHKAFTAVENVELHALQRCGDLYRVERLGLLGGSLEHPHLVDRARIPERHILLGAEVFLEVHRRLVAGIRDAFGDLIDLMIEASLLDRGRPAGAAGIVGVPVNLEAR